MQLEQLRYWLLCLPTLIPHGSGTSLPLELGWGRNSASLQLVADLTVLAKSPFPSYTVACLCARGSLAGAVKTRAVKCLSLGLLPLIGFCLQTLWRMGVQGRRLGPEDKSICSSSQPSSSTRASSLKLQLKTSLSFFQNCRLFLKPRFL